MVSITSIGLKLGGFFGAFIFCSVVCMLEFLNADGYKEKRIGGKRKRKLKNKGVQT